MTIILSILKRFKKFFTVRFLGKLAVKWISKLPPHLAYVATLPCETLMSPKQAINGDSENAGLENAGLENVGPNRRSGKGRTGKRGNIMCMGSEM